MITNLHQEIQLGESRTLEFKKELPAESSKWIKTIAAFANGAGGRLVIGVSNQREIVGIPKETDIFELKDKISDTISQMCTPQIMYDIYQESVENYGWGTGLKRIIDVCHEMNIREPEFLEIGDLLRVNLYRPTYKPDSNTEEKCPENALETDKLHCNCTVNVPEIALKTYSAFKENPHATAVELAKSLGVALRTVKNHLAILKQGGFIERVGSDKVGYWKITETGES